MKPRPKRLPHRKPVRKAPPDPRVPIPAFKGEFGLKIRWHVPWVYALGSGYIVEIEAGEEALYPLAKEWRIVPRASDDSRITGPGKLSPVKRFQPEPHVRQDMPDVDVVVCPRMRKYGAEKNWGHWTPIVDALRAGGFCPFAAGAPDSSYEVGCLPAWRFVRFLDASIQALRSCKLCIATDAGLAHLAVLCGTPLLLITYRGLVAPGPVINSAGRITERQYWPVKLQEYYLDARHTNAPIVTVDGWEWPERVIDKAIAMMRL